VRTALIPILLAGCPNEAPAPKAEPPSAEAPKADAQKLYADLLAKHVKDGRVAYATIEAEDLSSLTAYLDAVASAKPPEDRSAAIAFYADAYNALVIRSVIANRKPRSVLDVKGFFDEQKHRVAGQEVTLDALEKKVLKPIANDPRTHFILVCGAVGCPILESVPFAGSTVEERMDAATRRYLASPAGAEPGEGRIRLSMIFQWYEADFGGKQGVIDFVTKHLAPELAAKLGATPAVEPIDYNWTLNQQ
jgi:hypothetical protein